MFIADLLIALVVALLLSLFLIPIVEARPGEEARPAAAGLLFVFLILFFATWAGGIWLRPFGPPIWGAYWLPFVAVGFFLALLLAVAGEPSRRRYVARSTPPAAEPNADTAVAMTAFGAVFWILLIALLLALVAGYTMD